MLFWKPFTPSDECIKHETQGQKHYPIPSIVSFLKSSSEDVQVFLLVFLLLVRVGKESNLYKPKHFRPFRLSSSGIVLDHLLQWVLYIYIYVCVCVCVCVITVLVITKSLCGFVSNQIFIHSPRHAMTMFCSLAIVTYSYRNKIM